MRQSIGIVPQNTVLFNDTVGYNITRAQFEEAAAFAHIHGFISAKPLGYNSMADERELKLSGCEKQCVVIAHRLSTVVDAHDILVMEDGRIVERGTHAQLLALNQKYASMWNLQQNAK